MFAGHTKVLGGPYVARGPNVAQALYRWTILILNLGKPKYWSRMPQEKNDQYKNGFMTGVDNIFSCFGWFLRWNDETYFIL